VSWQKWIGSLGLGLSPIMPGTCGTLAGVAIALFVRQLPGAAWIFAGAALLITVLGAPLAKSAASEDPGWFVLDEVAGYFAVLIGLPVVERPWLCLVGAFVAFRVFDITKPWPIKASERIGGGWGVMIDDLVAAVYAHAVMRVVLQFA